MTRTTASDVYPCTCSAPCLELVQLREREMQCPTKQEAECRALLRCVMECADLVGLLPTASPRQLVDRVRHLMPNAEHDISEERR